MKIVILILFVVGSINCWDSLVASNPSAATSDLYNRFLNEYGQHVFSGQTEASIEDVKNIVGSYPIIRDFDMQNYALHNPWHDDWSGWDDGNVQRAIDYYHNTGGKGIVAFQWHWFAPTKGQQKQSTFYIEHSGGFDINQAVNYGTEEYWATLRDIDEISKQLKRLRDAGVPVLWRPLHEASGNAWHTPWFWWGAKGAEPYKKLWNMMFDRMNNYHGLNNLIWIYSINWDNKDSSWYPGKNQVDIVGMDNYPGSYNYDCESGSFMFLHDLVGGSKLVAMTEHGPVPDMDSCYNQGSKWAFFIGWADLTGSQNDHNHLKNLYNNWRTIHL